MFAKFGQGGSKLVNFLWFQTIWVLALVYQYDYLWLIMVLLAGFFLVARTPLLDACAALVVTLVGTAADSLFALTGIFVFPEQPDWMPIPGWLMALWAAFALTLRHSMQYLQSRWLICALLASVSGPASYYAGWKLGAVEFSLSVPVTLLFISMLWVWLLPVLFILVTQVERRWPLWQQAGALSNQKEGT